LTLYGLIGEEDKEEKEAREQVELDFDVFFPCRALFVESCPSSADLLFCDAQDEKRACICCGERECTRNLVGRGRKGASVKSTTLQLELGLDASTISLSSRSTPRQREQVLENLIEIRLTSKCIPSLSYRSILV